MYKWQGFFCKINFEFTQLIIIVVILKKNMNHVVKGTKFEKEISKINVNL